MRQTQQDWAATAGMGGIIHMDDTVGMMNVMESEYHVVYHQD
jgi:hypothetical protein